MKYRVIWKMFILEILTLGIYRLYFFVKTRREIMNLKPEVNIMTPAFLFAPLLSMIIGMIMMVGFVVSSIDNTTCVPNSSQTSETALSGPPSTVCTGGGNISFMIAFYLLFFVAFGLFVVWLWSYSKGVEAVTEGKLSFALILLLLIVVPDGIDILILQDYYNKIEAPQLNTASAPPISPSV